MGYSFLEDSETPRIMKTIQSEREQSPVQGSLGILSQPSFLTFFSLCNTVQRKAIPACLLVLKALRLEFYQWNSIASLPLHLRMQIKVSKIVDAAGHTNLR